MTLDINTVPFRSPFARTLVGGLELLTIILGTLLAYLIVGTLVFGTDKLRLDSQCENSGMLGSFEETLLGRRFWRIQGDLLDQQITYWESIPQDQARLDEIDRQTTEQTEKLMEEVYAKNPELRLNPTQRQKEVQALRDKADAIERAESREIVERNRVAKLEELRHCKQISSSKAG